MRYITLTWILFFGVWFCRDWPREFRQGWGMVWHVAKIGTEYGWHDRIHGLFSKQFLMWAILLPIDIYVMTAEIILASLLLIIILGGTR